MRHVVPLRTALSYAAGDIAPSLTSLCLSLFWLYFLIQVAGITPLHAGVIHGSGFVFSAAANLWAGQWLDRHVRSPRASLRLIAGSGVAQAVTFTFLWTVPPVRAWREAWYLAWSWLYHVLFAFAYLPYISLTAFITPRERARVDLNSWRLGSTMLLSVLLLVAYSASDGVWPIDRRLLMLGIAVSILVITGSVTCSLGLRNAVNDTAIDAGRTLSGPPRRIPIIRSRVLWWAIAGNLAVWFIVQSVLVLTIFLCAAAGVDDAMVMLVLQLSVIAAALLVTLAVRRWRPETLLRGSAVLWCVGSLLWLDLRTPVAAAMCLGFGLGAATVLTWARMPDALDRHAAAAGARVDARAYAALTVLRDLVSAVVPVLAAFALGRNPVGSVASGNASAMLLVGVAVVNASVLIAVRLPASIRAGGDDRAAAPS